MYLLPVALLKGWAACSHGPEGANPGCTSQITMERKQYAKETWQPLRVELLGTAETMALYRTPPNFRGEVGGGGGGGSGGVGCLWFHFNLHGQGRLLETGQKAEELVVQKAKWLQNAQAAALSTLWTFFCS